MATCNSLGPVGALLRCCSCLAAAGILLVPAAAQVSWQQMLVQPGPGHRASHAMTYDEARGRTVLFGGSGLGNLADTWEWDGTVWQQRFPATSPAAPAFAQMVYDAVRNIIVCYGTFGNVPQLWEYDGTNWYQRITAIAPPRRGGFALCFDRGRGRTVVFGGSTASYLYPMDTWEWDGITWTQHAPAIAPHGRSGAMMAFDPVRQRVLLFGGLYYIPPNQGTQFTDTWEWDGTSWSQLNPPRSPPVLPWPLGTTHGALNRLLLFDLSGGPNPPNLWEWDGSTWIPRVMPQVPTSRYATAIAYDLARNRVVLFGGGGGGAGSFRGFLNDTWEWDAATWSRRSAPPPAQPVSRFGHGMTYHTARQRVVMFGGCDAGLFTDMWEWDGAGWTQLAPSATPSGRYTTVMTDHASRGEVILYGGQGLNGVPLGDTWVWNGSTWTQRAPATSPPPLYGHALAYDSGRDRTVLFGGTATFEWDGTTWSPVSTPQQPPIRSYPAMAYDAGRRRVVLFGGGFNRSDTWEYDGSIWVQRFPAQSPPADYEPMMTWDAARQRVVLFGHDPRTWEWDGTTWTARSTAVAPHPRGAGGLAYDAIRRRVVLFSGIETGTWPDTWEYGPDFPAAWSTFGAGCPGSAGVPALAAQAGQQPWLGGAFPVSIASLPAASLAVLFLGSRTSWGAVPLPQPLAPVGMPGCSLLASGALVLTAQGSGGQATTILQIPADPALLGAALHGQALVPDPGVNAAGLVASHGGTVLFGGR